MDLNEKVSYSLGMSVSQNISSSGFNELKKDIFFKGFTDALEGNSTEISQEEASEILNDFFSSLSAKLQEKAQKEGQDFLANNKDKEGVVCLPSGLQYKILNQGSGAKPKATDSVKCHYHGMLVDGTVFDSSIMRGEPAVFPVNGVIHGWVEALQLMNTGSKWRLYIPSHLAYGEQGAGAAIPPHATLLFDVELLEIM